MRQIIRNRVHHLARHLRSRRSVQKCCWPACHLLLQRRKPLSHPCGVKSAARFVFRRCTHRLLQRSEQVSFSHLLHSARFPSRVSISSASPTHAASAGYQLRASFHSRCPPCQISPHLPNARASSAKRTAPFTIARKSTKSWTKASSATLASP